MADGSIRPPLPDFDDLYDEAGAAYNLDPRWIKAHAMQESGGDPYKIGPDGEDIGVMQLRTGTAQGLGVDDRLDPRQNIFGGAKYLRQMLDRFDDPARASMAYNAGPAGRGNPEYARRVNGHYEKLKSQPWRQLPRAESEPESAPFDPATAPPLAATPEVSFDDLLTPAAPAAAGAPVQEVSFDDLLSAAGPVASPTPSGFTFQNPDNPAETLTIPQPGSGQPMPSTVAALPGIESPQSTTAAQANAFARDAVQRTGTAITGAATAVQLRGADMARRALQVFDRIDQGGKLDKSDDEFMRVAGGRYLRSSPEERARLRQEANAAVVAVTPVNLQTGAPPVPAGAGPQTSPPPVIATDVGPRSTVRLPGFTMEGPSTSRLREQTPIPAVPGYGSDLQGAGTRPLAGADLKGAMEGEPQPQGFNNAASMLGREMTEAGGKQFQVAPEREHELGTRVAGLLGGIAPIILGGAIATAVAGPAGGAAVLLPTIAAQSYDSTYEAAVAKGVPPLQADRYALANAAVQVPLMAGGIGRLFQNVPEPVKEGFLKTLVNFGRHGVEFMTLGTTAKFAENYIAQQTFNPDQKLMEGVGDTALESLIAGIAISAGGMLLRRTPRPTAGNEPPKEGFGVYPDTAWPPSGPEAGQPLSQEALPSPESTGHRQEPLAAAEERPAPPQEPPPPPAPSPPGPGEYTVETPGVGTLTVTSSGLGVFSRFKSESGRVVHGVLNRLGYFVNPTEINRAAHENDPDRQAWTGTPDAQRLLAQLYSFSMDIRNSADAAHGARQLIESIVEGRIGVPDAIEAASRLTSDASRTEPPAAISMPAPEQSETPAADRARAMVEQVLPNLAPRGDRTKPVAVQEPDDLAAAGAAAAEPTPAQAAAGNYRMGHITVDGLPATIETPEGGIRRSKPGAADPWEVEMPAAYGYIKGSRAADGDHVDVYFGPETHRAADLPVYVIDQRDAETGDYDEAKAMIGFPSREWAQEAYQDAFADGRGAERMGAVTEMPWPAFRGWVESKHARKPLRPEAFERAPVPAQRAAPGNVAQPGGEVQGAPPIGAQAEPAAPGKRTEVPATAVKEAAPAAVAGPAQPGEVDFSDLTVEQPPAKTAEAPRASETPRESPASDVTATTSAAPNAAEPVPTYANPRRGGRIWSGPMSLGDFLATNGGIRNQGGDLKNLDILKHFVPGAGRLVRTNGHPLDRAREAAEEAGYLQQGSTVADLLEALDEEINRGRPVFSRHDAGRMAAASLENSDAHANERADAAAADVETLAASGGINLLPTEKADAARLVVHEGLTPYEALVEVVDGVALETLDRIQAEATKNHEPLIDDLQEILDDIHSRSAEPSEGRAAPRSDQAAGPQSGDQERRAARSRDAREDRESTPIKPRTAENSDVVEGEPPETPRRIRTIQQIMDQDKLNAPKAKKVQEAEIEAIARPITDEERASRAAGVTAPRQREEPSFGRRGKKTEVSWKAAEHHLLEYPGGAIDYGVSSDGTHATINMVRTKKEARGQGSAERALRDFVAAADDSGITLSLTAEPMEKGISKGRLESLYRRLGFVPNRGRNKDFATKEAWVRAPLSPSFGRRVPLYSAVERAIGKLSQAKGTGEQMLAQITKAPGVKAEEVKWLGLDEWLRPMKSVTRDQIKDYVAANQLQVEEVLRGEPGLEWQEKTERDGTRVLTQGVGQEAPFRRAPRAEITIHPDGSIFATSRHRMTMEFTDLDEAKRFAGDEVTASSLPTRYPDYKLPGGREGYRELLIMLPHTPEPAGRMERLPSGKYVVNTPGGTRETFGTEAEARAEMQRLGDIFNRDKGAYKSKHWDEPNVIAHVRFTDRVAPDGKKVLMLEEVQSDYGQHVRKHGEEDVPLLPFSKTWPTLAMRRMIAWAVEHGYDRVAWSPGDVQAARYPEEGAGREAVKEARESGMRGFYDRILPAETNKIVGRFGAKVENGSVQAGREEGEWVLRGPDDYKETFQDRNLAEGHRRHVASVNGRSVDDYQIEHEGAAQEHPVHQVTLTPQLRDAVRSEGLPLFQRTPGDDVAPHPAALQAMLDAADQMLGGHVQIEAYDPADKVFTIKFRDPTTGKESTEQVFGYAVGRLIRMALEGDRAGWNLDHEALHSLVKLGVIRPDEWSTLIQQAKREDWAKEFDIDGRYPGLPEDARLEEAIAEKFAQTGAKGPLPAGLLGRIMGRIRQFLARMRNLLQGRGFQTAEDVFGRMREGEIGRREPGSEGPQLGPRTVADSLAEADTYTDRTFGRRGEERPEQTRDQFLANHIARASRVRKLTALLGTPLRKVLEVPKVQEVLNGQTMDAAKEKLGKIKRSILMGIDPMSTGPDPMQKIAKDFANDQRAVAFHLGRLDKQLLASYSPEQRATMGQALNEQSEFEQNLRDDLKAMESDAVTEAKEASRKAKATGGTDYAADKARKKVRADWVKRIEATEDEHRRKFTGKGLDRLPSEQRAMVELLDGMSRKSWGEMEDSGIVRGERLPYYMPREFVDMIGEGGEFKRVGSNQPGSPQGIDPLGANVNTSGPMRRKYREVEETIRAARTKLGGGATLVTDIRALLLAVQRAQTAVASRELINSIRKLGENVGIETVSDQKSEATPFTIADHPAFRSYEPRYKRNSDRSLDVDDEGKPQVVKDEDGRTVMDWKPLYVAREMEGPLRAILSKPSGEMYKAIMNVKGFGTSIIMVSPMIHNAVIWGRAFELNPGKMLSFNLYRVGHQVRTGRSYTQAALERKPIAKLARKVGIEPKKPNQADAEKAAAENTAFMDKMIRHGMVPINGGWMQDILGIAQEAGLPPGKSVPSKLLGAAVGAVAGDKAKAATRRGVDAFGDFWHGTLLWDRIADLQAGIAYTMHKDLTEKGLSDDEASYVTAHFANRFAGVLPPEGMNNTLRKVLNGILFSRQYTLGNAALAKDAFTGLPSDVRAQLSEESDKIAAEATKSIARRMMIGSLLRGMFLTLAVSSVIAGAAQMFLSYARDDDPDDSVMGKLSRSSQNIVRGYVRRFADAVHERNDKPWRWINPIDWLSLPYELAPMHENEPGKEDRIFIGLDNQGRGIYIRLPTGKSMEELKNWFTKAGKQLRAKLSTFAGPVYSGVTGRDSLDRPLYNLDDDTFQTAQKFVLHFMQSQVPMDVLQGGYDYGTGAPEPGMSLAKSALPLGTGITVSRGDPLGPAGAIQRQVAQRKQAAITEAWPKAVKQAKAGNVQEAMTLLIAAGETPDKAKSAVVGMLVPEKKTAPTGYFGRTFELNATDRERKRLENVTQ